MNINYQQELNEALRRTKYDDSPNKKKWKMAVLKDSYQCCNYIISTIDSSRESRDRMGRSLDATKDLISKYHDFSNEYNNAIQRLHKRIEDDDIEQVESSKSLGLNIKKVLPSDKQRNTASPKKIRIADKKTRAQIHRQTSKFEQ